MLMNKKSLPYIASILLVVVLFYICFIHPYPYRKAHESFTKYISDQKVDNSNIETLEKSRDTKIGGILYTVTYKDDPNLRYEYLYSRKYDENINPYKICLIVYDNKNNSTDVVGVTPKYPPIEIKKAILNISLKYLI